MTALQMQSVINIGREMISQPVKLLDGVNAVLDDLADKYELVLITKGDLVDQERKVIDSGLSDYFQGIEIVSEKGVDTYRTIFCTTW
jgi:putative hydrolase of the HAD superfamily